MGPAPSWREKRGVWLLLILVAIAGMVALIVIEINSLSSGSPATGSLGPGRIAPASVIVGQAAPPCGGLNTPSNWTDVIDVRRGDVVIASQHVRLGHLRYAFRVPPGRYDLVDADDPTTVIPMRLNARETLVATFAGPAYVKWCETAG